MRRAIVFGLWLLALSAAQAQTKPDLKAVLKKISEIYKAATEYEFIGEATCRAEPPNTVRRVHVLIAYKEGKYRMEGSDPCAEPGDRDMGQALIVFDGSSLWTYSVQENQYYGLPASALTLDADGDAAGLRPDSVEHGTMSPYRDAADSPAEFIREENGSYVAKITPKDHSPEQTWWIDKTNYHVVRIDDGEMSLVFTTIILNESLPDDLFKFTPPPDAKKIRPDQ